MWIPVPLGASGLRSRMRMLLYQHDLYMYLSAFIRSSAANSTLEPGRGEPDQLLRGPGPVRGVADAGGSLDQAEICHGIGQGAGQEVQAPVQLLLRQDRDAGRDRPGEVAQHVAVALGQELAQAVVLLGVVPADDADEGTAAVA